MIETSNMVGIFPVPILYDYQSEYEFTSNEREYLYSHKTRKYENQQNNLSIGGRILDHHSMKSIKKFLQNYLDRYTKDILKIDQKFYITQSWFTKNNFGESHHRHCHQNSIVSGVMYVNAGPDMGNITFHRHPYTNTITKTFDFVYDYSEYNLFNSDQWWFEVKTGTVILFPSNLEHSVSENKTSEPRMCIGFNSFVSGKFGNEERLTNLVL